MKRALVVIGTAVAMLPALSGVASAHAVSVATPSGQTHVQVLHAGKGLPPHSGAFEQVVTCRVNGTSAAATILGPSSCP